MTRGMYLSIKLEEGGVVPTRVQILRTGKFNSDQYGKFEITKDHLLSFKKNFDEKVRGYDDGKLPIDYFHEADKVAAGWIESLELAEDGESLYATVKWTKRAKEIIEDGQLRYLSADLMFDYKSNEGETKHGPTLFGAGLTNRPFVKGMDAVMNFSDRVAEHEKNIRKALADGQKPAYDPKNELDSQLPQDLKDRLKKFSEGGNKMDLEQALAKIKELEAELAKAKGGQSEELSSLQVKYSELTTKLAESEKEKALAEKKGQFDKMLSEGKAVEAQRESFMSADMVKFAELAKPLNTEARGSEGGQSESDQGGEKDASDKIIGLAEAVAKKENISIGEAQARVLADPEHKALADEYSASVKI